MLDEVTIAPKPTKKARAGCAIAILVLGALVLGGIGWWRHFLFNVRRKTCASMQLRDIAHSCDLYAEAHKGVYPDAIEDIGDEYLVWLATKVTFCPDAEARKLPGPHYVIEPGLRTGMPGSYIMLYDISLQNHGMHGRNVCLLDGKTEWWPAEREHEFQLRLAKQRKAAREWRKKKSMPGPALGGVRDGLRFSLAVDKATIKAGEEATLTVMVENVSAEKFRYRDYFRHWLLQWRIAGPDEYSVENASDAKIINFTWPPLEEYPELPPGQKKSYRIKLAGNPPTFQNKLTKKIRLLKPGTYRIAASYFNKDAVYKRDPEEFGGRHVPGKVWTGRVKSNEVTLEVTGKLASIEDTVAKAVNGLQLRLSAASRRFKAGEEIELQLTVKNVSKEPLSFYASGLRSNERLNMSWDVAGPDHASTRYDQDGFFSSSSRHPSCYPELAPGEEKTYKLKITGNPPRISQLGSRNFMFKPGPYRLRVIYKNRGTAYYDHKTKKHIPVEGTVWTGRVTSNEVLLELEGDFKPPPPQPNPFKDR